MMSCLFHSTFTKLNILKCSLSHCLGRMVVLRSRYFTPLLDYNLGDHTSVAIWILSTTISLSYVSDLLSVKQEYAVDESHWLLWCFPVLLTQEYLHQETWLSGKLLQVLTIRGEQNLKSSKAEFLEKWQTSGGKGRTEWENELNTSTQCHKSAVLTSSHGAILWIMSFRWPIIRSSWKSYGNVSVHSVSNCKILGPNFLIRAWNGNQNDA